MNAVRTSNIKLEGNKLEVVLLVNYEAATENKGKGDTNMSTIFTVGGLVSVQFQIDVSNNKAYIIMKHKKYYLNDSVEYKLKVSFRKTYAEDWCAKEYITTCNIIDCLLHTFDGISYDFSLRMSIELNVKTSPKFSFLHDDTELTDIELIGDDGSIALHRSVLACQSPVMKTMLTGEWKETKDGRVNVPGLSMQALEHLKNYLYLDDLPDIASELEPLLDFAYRYMMTDLMQLCSTKILFNVTSNNAMHFLELAMKYKINKLLYGIMNMHQGNSFNLDTLLLSYCGNEGIL